MCVGEDNAITYQSEYLIQFGFDDALMREENFLLSHNWFRLKLGFKLHDKH